MHKKTQKRTKQENVITSHCQTALCRTVLFQAVRLSYISGYYFRLYYSTRTFEGNFLFIFKTAVMKRFNFLGTPCDDVQSDIIKYFHRNVFHAF